MADQFTGRVLVQSEDDGLTTIILNGNSSEVLVGDASHAGAVIVRDDAGTDRVRIRPLAISVLDNTGQIVFQLDGATGDVQVGASGARGQITVHNGEGVATIRIGGGDATVELGAQGQDGDLLMKDGDGIERIALNSRISTALVKNEQGQDTIKLNGQDANLHLGGNDVDGDIRLFPGTGDLDDSSTATIHLDGEAGDIILQNADVAEDFDVRDPETIEPGTVVVIGDDSRLRTSTQSYDRRVAGVVTGTGPAGPGIILGRSASICSRLPVALVGRISCRVDATSSPIMIGDLLTTSVTPGHAMKADDPTRAHGAIIGKALQPQPQGTGTIPILVALQ
jgi:hypothetical protein